MNIWLLLYSKVQTAKSKNTHFHYIEANFGKGELEHHKNRCSVSR